MQNSWVPSPMAGVTIVAVEANGRTFEVAEAGAGNHLALCLHGFPELNYSWRYQMPLLAKMGYRVWAPNQRGYGSSTRPKNIENYTIDSIVADTAALFDASKALKLTLIGHDWGGAIAWFFAITTVRPIERLVVMNLPHPYCMIAALRHWPQLRRSWYVAAAQIPWLPEWWLGRREAAQIRRIFYDMAVEKSRFTADVLDVYATAAKQPGALTAMLNWYRAAIRYRAVIANDGRVDVPVLIIWGEEDRALGLETLDGVDRYVADITIRRLPGVSHWVQQEAPETVNAILAEWPPEQP
jgi:pimeloyl-ACP methyl ester carboxylesterase